MAVGEIVPALKEGRKSSLQAAVDPCEPPESRRQASTRFPDHAPEHQRRCKQHPVDDAEAGSGAGAQHFAGGVEVGNRVAVPIQNFQTRTDVQARKGQ